MITWMLFNVMNPVGIVNVYTCIWCGVIFDMFLFGQIVQKIEKIVDKHHKKQQD